MLDLYDLTAGEIESRDTENRRYLTAEQRKNIRPDIDRTDVVFADEQGISLDYLDGKPFRQNIKDILSISDEEAKSRKANGEYLTVLEHTPQIILDKVSSAKDMKVIMRFDSAYLEARANGVLKGNYHNYGVDFANKLNFVLNNPDVIMQLKNGRLNLLGEISTDKSKTSLVSVELNAVKNINNKYDKYNLVVTMTPVTENNLNNLIKDRVEKIEYEKEDLSQVNPQLHKSLSIINDKSSFDDSIAPYEQSVNTNISEKAQNDTEEHSIAALPVDKLLDLYDLTAGEIEARDTENRRNLTAEQRKTSDLILTGRMWCLLRIVIQVILSVKL